MHPDLCNHSYATYPWEPEHFFTTPSRGQDYVLGSHRPAGGTPPWLIVSITTAAASGPQGQAPDGYLTWENKGGEMFFGRVTCLLVDGSRAAIGAVGQDRYFGRAPRRDRAGDHRGWRGHGVRRAARADVPRLRARDLRRRASGDRLHGARRHRLTQRRPHRPSVPAGSARVVASRVVVVAVVAADPDDSPGARRRVTVGRPDLRQGSPPAAPGIGRARSSSRSP